MARNQATGVTVGGQGVRRDSGANGASAGGASKQGGNGGAATREESEKSEDDEDEDKEYEVEAIEGQRVDKKGKNEFLVKWKDYNGQATWEPEENLGHAKALVKAFQVSRKAALDAKLGNNRATKADSITSSTLAVAPAAKKAKMAPSSSSTPKGGAGAPALPQPAPAAQATGGKGKSTGGRGKAVHVSANAGGQRKRKAAASDEEYEEEPRYSQTHTDGWEKYDHLTSWEDIVLNVDTVIRNERGTLLVYITMKGNEKISLEREIAYDKCPQQVLRFYEAHLRWKQPAED